MYDIDIINQDGLPAKLCVIPPCAVPPLLVYSNLRWLKPQVGTGSGWGQFEGRYPKPDNIARCRSNVWGTIGK